MKILGLLFVICLLVTGMASAKAVDSSISSSIANPAIASSGIYTLAAHTECSDSSATVGTPLDMGDLDVDSIPNGAAVSLDGSPWTYKHCIDPGWGLPIKCFTYDIVTPATHNVATGTHTIKIELSGYKSYSGTVNICSQKTTYVYKDLVLIPTTTTTAPTTAVTTAPTTSITTATVTTAAATTATTAAVTAITTAAATTAAVPSATTAAGITATHATSGAAAPGTGSLSITTTPAGAAVYLDGVQRGVSPAVIPGIPQGSHTILLKLDGYSDLSAPVYVTGGIMNDFSTGLTPLSSGGAAAAAAATTAQTPGFEAVFGLAALGLLVYLRNGSCR
jgi:uncharacterized membrane protein